MRLLHYYGNSDRSSVIVFAGLHSVCFHPVTKAIKVNQLSYVHHVAAVMCYNTVNHMLCGAVEHLKSPPLKPILKKFC